MKNSVILIVTLLCFALFSYAHYSIQSHLNPTEMTWKQFESDGTLVYSNSGKTLQIVGFFKSLFLSIPFGIILMIKLKFLKSDFKSVIQTSFLINVFVLFIGFIFCLISIPIANLFFKPEDSQRNSLESSYPFMISNFVLVCTLIGIFFGTAIICLLSHKKLQKILKN